MVKVRARARKGIVCSIVVVTGLAGAASLSAAGVAVRPLFEAGVVESSGPNPPSIAATSSRRLAFDAAAFAAPAIALGLEPDSTSVYEPLAVEKRAGGDLAWSGALVGEPDSTVSLTLRDGHLAGLAYANGAVYEIAPVARGEVVVSRLDPARFPPCGSAVEAVETAAAPASEGVVESLVPPATGVAARRLDVLVVYTPEARAAAGGAGPIATTIQAAVDQANQAFAESGMATRFRLARAVEVSHSDAGTIATDLAWLRDDPAVASLRETVKADLVSLFVESGDECGRGYVLSAGREAASFATSAFQVTRRSCAVGNLSWVHEHGHNLGMQHDPENGAPPSAAFQPDAYGHFVDGSYRTIMAYSSGCAGGCVRYPRFSNPDVDLFGTPTGVLGERDNHRVGDLVAAVAAGWRGGQPLFDDGFENGGRAEWSSAAP